MKKRQLRVYMSAVATLFAACSSGSNLTSTTSARDAASQTSAPQPLSAQGQQELRGIVESGRFADLRWPNFSDRKAAVQDFYNDAAYQLAWTRGGQVTPQALQLITILDFANQKGLDSQDYDGTKWPDRVKALQAPGGATESALVKLDVALTVSAIRYSTDLHMGKVDPKTLHKDFDPDREKHDPGEFLWKNVVNASDVKVVLAQIEPPYPGYQRALGRCRSICS
jgi:L,D-transpeptidase YcbB